MASSGTPPVCADRRAADQRAPGEHDAQPRLRPPGDALHQRIERHQRQRDQRHDLRQRRQRQQHDEADEALRDQPRPRRLQRHRAGGQRAQARALDLGVDVAVEDVVIGAARAAHGDGAERGTPARKRRSSPVEPVAGARDGEAHQARQQQQLPADRPVEPRQLRVRLPRRGSASVQCCFSASAGFKSVTSG